MCGGCRDPHGDPTDSRGRLHHSNRINRERMEGIGFDADHLLEGGELYSSRSRGHYGSVDDQFMDDPSITQERYTRGYNPDYYGQDPPPLSRRSTYSAPDYGVDRGYLDEGEHRNRDEWRQRTGSMYDGWKSYKKISEQSIHDNLEYDRYLKATPMYRSGEQHAELARLARRASNSSLGAYSERMKHDLNYIGHYNDNKQRRGHLFYARDRRRAGMNAEKHLAFHNSFLD